MRWVRRYCLPTAIVGAILVCGFLIFQIGVATEYAERVKQQKTEQSADAAKPKENRIYTFWKWTTHDPVAFYTSVLAIFTFVLSVSTIGLWVVTWLSGRRQASDMEKAIAASVTTYQVAVANSEQQLRAYVTVQEIQMNTLRLPSTFPGTEFWRREVQGAIHTYEFTPVLRNGGQTPAINVTAAVSLRRFPEGAPANFEFPDEGEHGGGVIGPQTQWYAPPQTASAGIINPVDPAILLLWGAVEYDDVFKGTFRHRTEFCFQIQVKRVPVTGETWVGFIPYRRYNNVDLSCEADFDPHENKYH